MERDIDWGYFLDLSKSLFIADLPEQKEAAKREFVAESSDLNFVG